MEHWSVEDYKNFTNGKIRKTKYRANKTSIDGHTFDSKKEAEYYCELKYRLQAKEINGFCLQPTFMLAPGLKYKADFVVFNSDNTYEIIDVPGSTLGQCYIYVKNSDGNYVNGKVKITYSNGKSEVVDIPSSGLMFPNKLSISSISDVVGS